MINNTEINKLDLLITHYDLDGYGNNILFSAYYRLIDKSIKIINTNYGFDDNIDINKLLSDYDKIYITDLSLNENNTKISNNYPDRIKLIDHHQLSEIYHSGNNIIDTTKSATLLSFEFIYSELIKLDYDKAKFFYDNYKELSELISDYDLWTHNDSRSIELQLLFSASDKLEFVNRFINYPKIEFSPLERYHIDNKLKRLDDRYNSLLNNISEIKIDKDSNRYQIAKLDSLEGMSLVASRYLRSNDIDYIVLLHTSGISFRSNSTDVSKLANIFGGGGHKLSAGSPLPQLTNIEKSLELYKLVKLDLEKS